jgi:hypothetical protein
VTVDYALLILVTLNHAPRVMRAKHSLFLVMNGIACIIGGGYLFNSLLCHTYRCSLLRLVHSVHSQACLGSLLPLVHCLCCRHSQACQDSLLPLVRGMLGSLRIFHSLLFQACHCSLLPLVRGLGCQARLGSLLPLVRGMGCSHSQACQGSHDNLLPDAGSSLFLSI